MRPCTFCNRYSYLKHLTPLYDKNGPLRVRLYCDRCLGDVKDSILPHEEKYLWFGEKGEYKQGGE